MLYIRLTWTTLIAVLSMSGVVSAHSFNAEKAGALKAGKNAGHALFDIQGGVLVVCTTDYSNANVVAGNQLTVLADVSFLNCVADGIFSTTVSTAKYFFSADSTVNLENTVWINVLGVCDVTLKPQNTLKTVKYKNSGKNIIMEPSISGMKVEGSGGECTIGANKGTYSGFIEVESPGQTIFWA